MPRFAPTDLPAPCFTNGVLTKIIQSHGQQCLSKSTKAALLKQMTTFDVDWKSLANSALTLDQMKDFAVLMAVPAGAISTMAKGIVQKLEKRERRMARIVAIEEGMRKRREAAQLSLKDQEPAKVGANQPAKVEKKKAAGAIKNKSKSSVKKNAPKSIAAGSKAIAGPAQKKKIAVAPTPNRR